MQRQRRPRGQPWRARRDIGDLEDWGEDSSTDDAIPSVYSQFRVLTSGVTYMSFLALWTVSAQTKCS